MGIVGRDQTCRWFSSDEVRKNWVFILKAMGSICKLNQDATKADLSLCKAPRMLDMIRPWVRSGCCLGSTRESRGQEAQRQDLEEAKMISSGALRPGYNPVFAAF